MSDSEYEWTLQPEPHWERAILHDDGENAPKFVVGQMSEDRICVRYFQDPMQKDIWAHVRFGFLAQGPPGFAHGGSVAAVLDEAMGAAAWQADLTVVAAELNFRYKAPTPLFDELLAHAWIDRVDERIARIQSTIARPGERTLVAGSGRFVDIGREKYHAFAEAARARRERLDR